MHYTKELAGFCSSISFESIPTEVIQKAKLCLMDYVANVYGSLELEATRAVIDYIRSLGGPPTATALGCGFKTSVQNAAFINGTTAEAIESQDGLRFGGNHPVSAVIPAVLAVAESEKAGGKKILEAIVAGYEVANRISASMHPFHTLSGFLPTGTCGTFGAAAGVAKLFNYDRDAMINAIGNAGFLLPLSMAEHLMGGYTIKIVQGGQAASAGIMAAGLAGRGITGCPVVLEGSELKGGFTTITARAEPKLEKLTEELGKKYSIMDVYFKPFTACRHTHGAAQAVLELMNMKDLNASEIESITVFTYGVAVIAVGKGVPDGGSFVSAQFSIPYVVAACLLDGDLGPMQLTESRMEDPVLTGLAKRVTVINDEKLNELYPDKTASRIEIIVKGGEKLEHQVDIPGGDPRCPMEENDIVEKVHRFAGDREKAIITRIIDMCRDIDRLETPDVFVSLF